MASTSATRLPSINTKNNLSHRTEESQPSSQSTPAWLTIILDNVKKFHKKNKTVVGFIEIHRSLDQALLKYGGADRHISKALETWIDIDRTKHVSCTNDTNVSYH
jgi:hypothetical protein